MPPEFFVLLLQKTLASDSGDCLVQFITFNAVNVLQKFSLQALLIASKLRTGYCLVVFINLMQNICTGAVAIDIFRMIKA